LTKLLLGLVYETAVVGRVEVKVSLFTWSSDDSRRRWPATGYVYIDLNTTDYGGFVDQASKMLRQKLQLPAGYTFQWSGEYEFQLRAKERLKLILPVVFFAIFLLLYSSFTL